MMRTTLIGTLGLLACTVQTVTPPSTNSTSCIDATAVGSLSLTEGGRIAIPRTGVFAREGLTFRASGALSVVDEVDRTLVYAEYGSAGEQTITASCGETSTALKVTVRALTWTKVAAWTPDESTPQGREYGAWWLDDKAERIFLFGGYHYVPAQYTEASDLWSFDLASAKWTALSPTGDVPVAPGGRVARGPDASSTFYFGGAAKKESGALNTPSILKKIDYQGNAPAWTDAPFAASSPGSYTGALVYDSRRQRWLSVGGASDKLGFNNLVYAYTPAQGWSALEVAAGARPKGRDGFHYTYDDETDRLVVYAGQVGSANLAMIGDTWALELGKTPAEWVKLVDEASGPGMRRNGAYAFDPVGRNLFVWGGTADGTASLPGLQILNLDRGRERWRAIDVPSEVPARCSGMGLYDARHNRIYWGFGNDDAIYTDIWAMSL